MSAETLNSYENPDHKDSLLYMMMRREINERYAEVPVDFNVAGLEVAQEYLGRSFKPADTVIDIGSSSGSMVVEAAVVTDTSAHIVCVEPDALAAESHALMTTGEERHVSFVRAVGEQLPFADNSVEGATMHNVIFRARDAAIMLREAQRVVKPGGFIAISTNGRGHAHYRHLFEALVAEEVNNAVSDAITTPAPPAEGHYLEDLPDLFARLGGLTTINELYVQQDTRAIITPGTRLAEYLDSIRYSAANVALSPEHRSVWRRAVETVVAPQIADIMTKSDEEYVLPSGVPVPFFADPIKRGMFVLRNEVGDQT